MFRLISGTYWSTQITTYTDIIQNVVVCERFRNLKPPYTRKYFVFKVYLSNLRLYFVQRGLTEIKYEWCIIRPGPKDYTWVLANLGVRSNISKKILAGITRKGPRLGPLKVDPEHPRSITSITWPLLFISYKSKKIKMYTLVKMDNHYEFF